MQTLALVASLTALSAALTGCITPPASPSQRLAESANDMNTATRFGRMDIAMDFVATAAQGDFKSRHMAWGRDVWIVDLELLDVRIDGRDEASVHLTVAWQRPDETTLRVTQLKQRWRDDRAGWRMMSEERSSGDTGLLLLPLQLNTPAKSGAAGSQKAASQEPAKPARTSFQTRVIRAAD
jgi:hypothetical protein